MTKLLLQITLLASMVSLTAREHKDLIHDIKGSNAPDVNNNTIIININQQQMAETRNTLSAEQKAEQEKQKTNGHSKPVIVTIAVTVVCGAAKLGLEIIKSMIDSSGGVF